jgi:hypothetical protein
LLTIATTHHTDETSPPRLQNFSAEIIIFLKARMGRSLPEQNSNIMLVLRNIGAKARSPSLSTFCPEISVLKLPLEVVVEHMMSSHTFWQSCRFSYLAMLIGVAVS